MKLPFRHIGSLLAMAGLLFGGQASAAVKLSDVFDGNYFSPSESGRVMSVSGRTR